MKLSCIPVSYFKALIAGEMLVKEWARLARAKGLDAIDLSILFFQNRDQDYLKRTREEIEAAGIGVTVTNTYPDLTHPDPVERKRELSQLKEDIATAAFLGSKMVRVTSGQAHPETSRKEGVAWVIEGLKDSLAAAERCEVKLVYENHSKPAIWKYPDFNLPSDIFLEIAAGIKGAEIGILFDTANPIVYGDDPLDVLEHVIDRVVCVHASETRMRGALEPVALGKGIVPFARIFARLQHSGYDGWISIEEASGLGETGVEHAVNFVRRTWEEAVRK